MARVLERHDDLTGVVTAAGVDAYEAGARTVAGIAAGPFGGACRRR